MTLTSASALSGIGEKENVQVPASADSLLTLKKYDSARSSKHYKHFEGLAGTNAGHREISEGTCSAKNIKPQTTIKTMQDEARRHLKFRVVEHSDPVVIWPMSCALFDLPEQGNRGQQIASIRGPLDGGATAAKERVRDLDGG